MPSRVSEPETYGCEESPGLCSLISKNGFLPAEQPLRRLPNAYYEEWEEIVGDLPNLIKERAIRSKIDNMSLLTTAKLKTEREWQRAYVILSFLTHSYIWGGDVPSEILPPSTTVPFLQVSDHLQLPPIATYAALNLWNFSSTSSNSSSSTDSSCSTGEEEEDEEEFTDLDNLRALHTFSGTEDESWFYVLSVAAEARGARAIPVMLRATEAVRRGDHDAVSRGLVEMAGCVRGLARLLGRMQERCDPAVFYHQLRPFLAGTRNMTAAGLPADGVFYDEGDGEGRWRQLRGGSNGQSSLIQFFDLVLGVEHTSAGDRRTTTATTATTKTKTVQKEDGAPGELSFHEEVRFYMPGPHRKFLERVSRMDSIRDFVYSAPPSPSPAQRRLQQAYQEATRALGDFRQAHMQMVTRYIVVPSRQPAPPSSCSGVKNLATASSSLRSRSSSSSNNSNNSSNSKGAVATTAGLTGTGGTDLIPFLRAARDDTYGAGMMAVDSSRDASVVKARIAVDMGHHKELVS